jgi:C4-type Zn-finger protein
MLVFPMVISTLMSPNNALHLQELNLYQSMAVITHGLTTTIEGVVVQHHHQEYQYL